MEISQFSSLLQKNTTLLRSRAVQFTNDTDDAEDLVQDTLMRAFRFLHKFQDGTDMNAWLFVIMRNVFINSFRKKQRWQSVLVTEDTLTDNNCVHHVAQNLAEGNLIVKDVQHALAKLPKMYSTPFVRYFEGYKYQEIAQELGIPVGTVKTHIHQARLALRKNLKRHQYNDDQIS